MNAHLVTDVEDVFNIRTHSVMFRREECRIEHDTDCYEKVHPGTLNDTIEHFPHARHNCQKTMETENVVTSVTSSGQLVERRLSSRRPVVTLTSF